MSSGHPWGIHGHSFSSGLLVWVVINLGGIGMFMAMGGDPPMNLTPTIPPPPLAPSGPSILVVHCRYIGTVSGRRGRNPSSAQNPPVPSYFEGAGPAFCCGFAPVPSVHACMAIHTHDCGCAHTLVHVRIVRARLWRVQDSGCA